MEIDSVDLCLFHTADTTKDRTVLSCSCRRCEHNWRQDKAVLSCLNTVANLQLFSLKYIEKYWKLGNWKLGQDKRLSSLVANSVHTADMDKTNRFVLCVSAVWNGYYTIDYRVYKCGSKIIHISYELLLLFFEALCVFQWALLRVYQKVLLSGYGALTSESLDIPMYSVIQCLY